MKNKFILSLLIFGLSIMPINGCENTTSLNSTTKNTQQYEEHSTLSTCSDVLEEPDLDTTSLLTTSVKDKKSTTVIQDGPYGRISLSIPAGWNYKTYPMDSENFSNGLYGIEFFPKDVTDGYITLAYFDSFGVCGTELATDTFTIAGNHASIGTYDNHKYWDFISFSDNYSGIVALTYKVENWWEIYSEQVMEILNTLSFDSSIKEGGTYIYSNESEVDKIGLRLTLKKVSSSGAVLMFHQYDENAPSGELNFGDAFAIEVQKNNTWENVPIVINGNYGFHEVAYNIPKGEITEQKLDWNLLYGILEPGNYRIKKEIMDFRKSGDYDKYTVYTQFVLN